MSDRSGSNPLRWQLAQWLELLWWKRYLKGKSPEEYLAWKTSYWKNFLHKLRSLPALKHKHILDAGCGPAGVYLALEGNTVTATDPLLDSYATTLPHFSKDRYPYVRFRTEALEALADSNEYDITFCLNAINHVADIRLCFRKLVDATKPGGTVFVSIDAHRHSWLMPLFRLIPGDALHPHQYDLNGYIQLREAAGCTVTEKLLVEPGKIFDYWVLTGVKGNT